MFDLNFFYFEVKFQGLTGEVQFNLVTGERRVHNGLDILNVVQHNVKKVCMRRLVHKPPFSLSPHDASDNRNKLKGFQKIRSWCPPGAACTVCNILHGWLKGQKNEQQNNIMFLALKKQCSCRL